MSALETFRRETGAWLDANAPRSLFGVRSQGAFEGYWGGPKSPDPGPDRRRWLELMVAKGWTAPTWPKAYGGGGLSPEEARILDEEMISRALPAALVGMGLVMLGPVLLEMGSEEQKRTHLRAICEGTIRWCQGYSEPSSGSDLASLRTRAIRDGDDFVVDGQKVWTSFADLSDWIFCLVRTDPEVPKHGGISFLLIDMSAPGVTTRRIKLISGVSPFCETFFDSVRVPAKNVVHDVNAGWAVAKSLLNHERTTIGSSIARQMIEAERELVALARQACGPHEGPLADSHIRDQIARNAMRSTAFALTLKRLADGPPGPESSILKIVGTELKQRRSELAAEILGPGALGWEDPNYGEDALKITQDWLRNRASTIEGGTTEIQLNIIARRVLGLR